MRSRLAIGALAASLVGAGSASAAVPAVDRVDGSGVFACQPLLPDSSCALPRTFEFEFSAVQTGFGQHATGFIRRNVLPPFVSSGETVGRVTCLNVFGNHAAFGGYFTSPEQAAGNPFIVWIVDNGPPASVIPDQMSLFFAFGEPELLAGLVPRGAPNVCPQPFVSESGSFPVISGDIVVGDQSPPGSDQ